MAAYHQVTFCSFILPYLKKNRQTILICYISLKKKELVELEEELQSRVASVASHRVKIERLQAELALLGTQELGLKHALASDLGPTAVRGEIPYLSPLFFY